MEVEQRFPKPRVLVGDFLRVRGLGRAVGWDRHGMGVHRGARVSVAAELGRRRRAKGRALTGLRVAGYSRGVMNAMGYRTYGHWYWFHTPERR